MSDLSHIHIAQAGQQALDLDCADTWSRTKINSAKDLQVNGTMSMVEDSTTVTLGSKPVLDFGTVTSAATVNIQNNGVSSLSTSLTAMTLNINVPEGEAANAICEISTTNELTLTVTVTKGSANPVTCRFSDQVGNVLEAGHFYQVSCTGTCWMMADFGETGD